MITFLMYEAFMFVHLIINKHGVKVNQTLGGILSIGGLIGILYFGYQYLADSESFQVFGADVAVSTGDYVPILISVIVLVVGLFLYRSKQT